MRSEPIPEIVEGLPNISGSEDTIATVTANRAPVFLPRTPMRLDKLQSAFAVALHRHQPLILGDDDLRTAAIIGNLQFMMQNQHIHGNHDAPVFAWYYTRIADFIRELVDAGRQPRVMLDYSGELLFGFRQMSQGTAFTQNRGHYLNERMPLASVRMLARSG